MYICIFKKIKEEVKYHLIGKLFELINIFVQNFFYCGGHLENGSHLEIGLYVEQIHYFTQTVEQSELYQTYSVVNAKEAIYTYFQGLNFAPI